MSKTETIEEKTYRLVNEAHGNTFTSLTAALDNVAFAYTCKAIELAIAEEREVVAPYLNFMVELLSEAEEFEGEDGLMMGADINLWNEADKALDDLIDKQDAEGNHWKPLHLRHSAPKDEVSQ